MLFDLVQHVTSDIEEVRDDPIVHDSMPAKGERVVVDWGYCCGSSRSNVRKACCCGGIATDAVEICIVCRRLAVLVSGLSFAFTFTEIGSCIGVPRYSEAINVEQAIAHGNFGLGGRIARIVRD